MDILIGILIFAIVGLPVLLFAFGLTYWLLTLVGGEPRERGGASGTLGLPIHLRPQTGTQRERAIP